VKFIRLWRDEVKTDGNVLFALRPLTQPAKFKTKTRLKFTLKRVCFEFTVLINRGCLKAKTLPASP
jgi:hypothetical protein